MQGVETVMLMWSYEDDESDPAGPFRVDPIGLGTYIRGLQW